MSVNDGQAINSAVNAQSPPGKSFARVANMNRINEEKRRKRELGELKPGEDGGRPIQHEENALAARIHRGLDPNGPLFAIMAERRDAYLSDLGGPANASEKEADMCSDLAAIRLTIQHIDAQLIGGHRLTWTRRMQLYDLRLRYTVAFKDIAIRLGLKRVAKQADREIIVRRYAEAPTPAPDNGHAQGEHKEAAGLRPETGQGE